MNATFQDILRFFCKCLPEERGSSVKAPICTPPLWVSVRFLPISYDLRSLRLSVVENIEFLGASRRLKHHSRNMPDIDNLRISLRQSLEAQVKVERKCPHFCI